MESDKSILLSTVLYQIDPIVYSSHLSMVYRFGKNMPDWNFIFAGKWRMPIDQARNWAADVALANNCKYLLFYDDDMIMDSNIIQHLVKRMEDDNDAHIIMAKCFIRGYPFEPMIFRFIDKEQTMVSRYNYKQEDIDEKGLVKVDAVGCAGTIIRVNLFKNMSKPFFFTGEHHTEDVYFCLKCRETYEKVNIYMDDTMENGHLLDKRILNSETRQNLIDDYNRGYDQFGMLRTDPIQNIDEVLPNPLENKGDEEDES